MTRDMAPNPVKGKWLEPRYLPEGVSPVSCTVTRRGTHVIVIGGKVSLEVVTAEHLKGKV